MVDESAIAELLAETAFASHFSPHVVQALANLAEETLLPAGAYLFREGEVHPRLYLVCTGRLGLDMHVPGRGSVRILTLEGGDLAAWSALLGEGRMTASAMALESSRLLGFDGPGLQAACQADPQLGYEIMHGLAKALARRLVATRLQLLDLYMQQPPQFEVRRG
jgi:CRP-like cAMP-binding protein